jgi:thioredoxin-dependent peroxiredoxin
MHGATSRATLAGIRQVSLLAAFVLAGNACDSAAKLAQESPQQKDRPSAAGALRGSPAPDVELQLDDGTHQQLRHYLGKNVVLYFYPKDQTRGCTIEAQGFRDSYQALLAKDVVVLGVSVQGTDSHRAFIEKEELPFRLVADTSGDVARAFGVELKAGQASRDTIWIDPQGKIARIWRGVSPKDHARTVLREIAAEDTLRKHEQ